LQAPSEEFERISSVAHMVSEALKEALVSTQDRWRSRRLRGYLSRLLRASHRRSCWPERAGHRTDV